MKIIEFCLAFIRQTSERGMLLSGAKSLELAAFFLNPDCGRSPFSSGAKVSQIDRLSKAEA
jgi:hypothetical protein